MEQQGRDGRRLVCLTAEKARQGEIILRKPWQRIVFIVGLLAPLVFFLIGWLLAWKWA